MIRKILLSTLAVSASLAGVIAAFAVAESGGAAGATRSCTVGSHGHHCRSSSSTSTSTSSTSTSTSSSSSTTSTSTSSTTSTTSTTTSSAPGLHVAGNQLEDANGTVVRLHGVDRSGTEYACIQGWGIFDGPNVLNDDQEVPLIKAWHANEVLIGLNEDCWLGVNVSNQYTDTSPGVGPYANAIKHEVATIEANAMYPVLTLFWGAPGSQQATGQEAMNDNDHSAAFWQSVASTFKGDPNVVLRLKEEPYPGGNTDTIAAWTCWSQGDVQYGTSGQPISQNTNCAEGYKTVGMQSLVNVIRATGNTDVIAIPGVEYANSMTHFLDPGIRVTDTLNPPQLMGVVDTYPNGNTCGSTSCYDTEYAPVANAMPFMFGEFGESVSGSDCTTTGVDAIMNWADAHGAGYSGWVWDTWGGCLQLITSYTTGAPNGAWGTDLKNRMTTTFP